MMTISSLAGPAAIAALPRDRLLAEFSLWSADLANMERELRRIEPYADLHHVDVADGVFAPSFLFFPDLVARIARLTQRPIHVHLMVEARDRRGADPRVRRGRRRPRQRARRERRGRPARRRLAHEPRRRGRRGAAARDAGRGDRARSSEHVAFVTLLGTAIGVKGQGLSEHACDRLAEARRLLEQSGRDREIILAADGGIRHETVPRLRAAGAETVVLGSLAFGDPDLAGRIRWLHALEPAPR